MSVCKPGTKNRSPARGMMVHKVAVMPEEQVQGIGNHLPRLILFFLRGEVFIKQSVLGWRSVLGKEVGAEEVTVELLSCS